MRIALLVAFSIASFLGSAAQAAELRLTWSVVQPFRLLRFESDQKIHEWALADIMADATITDKDANLVSELEKRLNSPSWWQKKPPGSTKTYVQLFDELRAADPNRTPIRFDPRLGWASMLRNEPGNAPIKGTCWDAVSKTYRGCRSDIGQINGDDDYVFPKRHLVQIAVETKNGTDWQPLTGQCRLELATPPNAGFGLVTEKIGIEPEKRVLVAEDCSKPVFLRAEYGASYELSAAASAAPTPAAATIAVRDLLIVGIGDSFGSGEGNPELPVTLDRERARSPYVGISDTTITTTRPGLNIPTRKLNQSGQRVAEDTQARWLDPQCHRSIYSAQARAALALALHGQRHHAVTFVSYACSGAEVTDGVFWPQDHRECGPNTALANRFFQPQISGVVDSLTGGQFGLSAFAATVPQSDRFVREIQMVQASGWAPYRDKKKLCPTWPGGNAFKRSPQLKTGQFRRPIDLLFVSIGGNDIGFAPLVSKVVVNSGLLNVPIPGVTELAVQAFQSAANAIDRQEAERRIDRDLDPRFALLSSAIQSKLEIETERSGIAPASRVILTAYPRLANKTATDFCGGGNRGLNVSTLLSVKAQSEVRPGDVTPAIADAVTRKLNGKLRSIATANGWTFVDGHVEKFKPHGFCATGSSVSDAAAPTAEILDLPNRDNAGWKRFGTTAYNPATDFYPYAMRERWVRTFNDSYLLAFYFKTKITEELIGGANGRVYTASRALGGPIHPTAEGHAHIADGIYTSAVKVLFENGEPR
ncbi:hypothetical protein [Sinorhizobium sp. BG8]|uniref:hypothetical protein n=1 Tax=Sinorhizobium sp. BG8 TaxID=2613773 RepID=UPI00193D07F7|nr:hypothetical protein [Sinorhizobium sp. BG8]QRM54594.1 hypothetical protein F3Y30_08570 [Sinorhizobium sp. BG8]